MIAIAKIKYILWCYNPKRIIWDYKFGKCSNIPLCCRLFFIFIWPWYCISDNNEKYILESQKAQYIECWVCKNFKLPYRKLQYCTRCKKRKKCKIYADIKKNQELQGFTNLD